WPAPPTSTPPCGSARTIPWARWPGGTTGGRPRSWAYSTRCRPGTARTATARPLCCGGSPRPAGRGHERACMTLPWTKETSPRWDADKQRIFGPAELAAVGLAGPAPGQPVADEWWRVTDGGQVAGYGWLDTEWGDARITFVVTPGRRGRGVG